MVVVEGVALFFGDFSRHFKMFPNVFSTTELLLTNKHFFDVKLQNV